MNNISEHLSAHTHQNYHHENNNLPSKNLFHCRLRKQTVPLDDYCYAGNKEELTQRQQEEITALITQQLAQLFNSSKH